MGVVATPLSILFGPEALEYRLQDSGAVARSSIPRRCPISPRFADRLPS